MKIKLSLYICFAVCAIPSIAQDEILLMNGQQFECKLMSDSGTVLVMEITKKNGRKKILERHKSDVFSYKQQGKAEKVLYVQDEMYGDTYTVQEMRMYMAGEKDARENYSAWPTGIGGFVVCGTVAYLGGDGLLTATLPPVIYACAHLIPKIKIREKTMSDVGYKYNDIYADGYEPPARSRKLQSALKGGVAGAAAGLGLWFLLN